MVFILGVTVFAASTLARRRPHKTEQIHQARTVIGAVVLASAAGTGAYFLARLLKERRKRHDGTDAVECNAPDITASLSPSSDVQVAATVNTPKQVQPSDQVEEPLPSDDLTDAKEDQVRKDAQDQSVECPVVEKASAPSASVEANAVSKPSAGEQSGDAGHPSPNAATSPAETAKTPAEATKIEEPVEHPVQSESEKHSQNGVNATPRNTENEVKPIQIPPNKGIGEEQEKLADDHQQRPLNDSKDQSGEDPLEDDAAAHPSHVEVQDQVRPADSDPKEDSSDLSRLDSLASPDVREAPLSARSTANNEDTEGHKGSKVPVTEDSAAMKDVKTAAPTAGSVGYQPEAEKASESHPGQFSSSGASQPLEQDVRSSSPRGLAAAEDQADETKRDVPKVPTSSESQKPDSTESEAAVSSSHLAQDQPSSHSAQDASLENDAPSPAPTADSHTEGEENPEEGPTTEESAVSSAGQGEEQQASDDTDSSAVGNVAESGASSPAQEQKPGHIDSVFAVGHPAPEQDHPAESKDAKSREKKQTEDQASEDQDAANKRSSDAAEQAPSPAQENGALSQTSKASQDTFRTSEDNPNAGGSSLSAEDREARRRKAVQAEEEVLAEEKPEMAGLEEGKTPPKKDLSRSASSKVRRALEEVLDPNTQSLGDDDSDLSDAKEIYKQISNPEIKVLADEGTDNEDFTADDQDAKDDSQAGSPEKPSQGSSQADDEAQTKIEVVPEQSPAEGLVQNKSNDSDADQVGDNRNEADQERSGSVSHETSTQAKPEEASEQLEVQPANINEPQGTHSEAESQLPLHSSDEKTETQDSPEEHPDLESADNRVDSGSAIEVEAPSVAGRHADGSVTITGSSAKTPAKSKSSQPDSFRTSEDRGNPNAGGASVSAEERELRRRKAVQKEEEALADQAPEPQEKNAEASQEAMTPSSSSAGKAIVEALDPETQDLGLQQPADDAGIDTERQVLKLEASESSAPSQAVASEQEVAANGAAQSSSQKPAAASSKGPGAKNGKKEPVHQGKRMSKAAKRADAASKAGTTTSHGGSRKKKK